MKSIRNEISGYLHPRYAQSLREFGIPYELSKCRGWILVRPIADFSYYDGTSCYPLFMCQDWSKLKRDLEELESKLVSLSVVTDPFGNYDIDYLNQCFKDIVIPFKKHFIVDLYRTMNSFINEHHSRNAKKALQKVHVEKCQEPTQLFNEWIKLYSNLIKRHKIEGIRAFSELAFINQLQIPGLVMFRAVHNESTVGITLWYIQEDIGYYHLGAYNALGYELRASFALFWFAIEYFTANNLRCLNLGGGAGLESSSTDGLSRFKSGWSTGTRTAYFCGRIFDSGRYSEIIKSKTISTSNYFPAYRQGEFE